MPVLLVPLAIIFGSAAAAALFWLTPLRGRLSITRLAHGCWRWRRWPRSSPCSAMLPATAGARR